MDLSQYKGTLLIIVLGGCFCTFSYVFDNALVVIRKQNLLVCAYVIAGLYIKATAHYMVEKWAMVGAALAYATTMLIFTLSVMAIFIVCLKRKNLNDEKK